MTKLIYCTATNHAYLEKAMPTIRSMQHVHAFDRHILFTVDFFINDDDGSMSNIEVVQVNTKDLVKPS
jgi:hypothetical protein